MSAVLPSRFLQPGKVVEFYFNFSGLEKTWAFVKIPEVMKFELSLKYKSLIFEGFGSVTIL